MHLIGSTLSTLVIKIMTYEKLGRQPMVENRKISISLFYTCSTAIKQCTKTFISSLQMSSDSGAKNKHTGCR